MAQVDLPPAIHEAMQRKYGVVPRTPPVLTRAHSFEADEPAPPEPEVKADVRALVRLTDRMPPPEVVCTQPHSVSSPFCFRGDPDPDLTTAAFDAIPETLRALHERVPRSVVRRESALFRGSSVLDPQRTLCWARDRRVARLIVALSLVDRHTPPERLACALRQCLDNPTKAHAWRKLLDVE